MHFILTVKKICLQCFAGQHWEISVTHTHTYADTCTHTALGLALAAYLVCEIKRGEGEREGEEVKEASVWRRKTE